MFRSTAPEPVQSPEASGRLVHAVFGDRTAYRIPEVRIERRVEGFAVHGHGPDLARSAESPASNDRFQVTRYTSENLTGENINAEPEIFYQESDRGSGWLSHGPQLPECERTEAWRRAGSRRCASGTRGLRSGNAPGSASRRTPRAGGRHPCACHRR